MKSTKFSGGCLWATCGSEGLILIYSLLSSVFWRIRTNTQQIPFFPFPSPLPIIDIHTSNVELQKDSEHEKTLAAGYH